MNAFTHGWVLTLLLFALFCGGSVYTYKILDRKSTAAAYERCVQSFARTAKDAVDFQHKIAVCKNDHQVSPVYAGRYGTSSGRPVSLAMMRRPDL